MAASRQCASGVAIVANNTWAALSAKKKLKVVWDETDASKDSWTALTAFAKAEAAKGAGPQELKKVGDVDAAFQGKKVVEGFYTFGFVSHATLEPMNTTAWYQKDPAGDKLEAVGCRCRSPTARVPRLPVPWACNRPMPSCNQMRCGGGFGRRLNAGIRLRGRADLQAGWRHSREADVHPRRRHDARLLPLGWLPAAEGRRGRTGQAGGLVSARHFLQ